VSVPVRYTGEPVDNDFEVEVNYLDFVLPGNTCDVNLLTSSVSCPATPGDCDPVRVELDNTVSFVWDTELGLLVDDREIKVIDSVVRAGIEENT